MRTKQVQKERTDTKDRNKIKMLEYLGDPANEFISRSEISRSVLKYKNPRSIYNFFSPAELKEIENEAMKMRKKASARQRAVLYSALYEQGRTGDVKAIKEFLDRTEGPVVKKTDNTHALTHEDLLNEILIDGN